VYGIVFLAVLGSGLCHGLHATLSRDGYAEAATFLRFPESTASGAGGRVIATNVPVLRCYLGDDRVAARPPASRAELADLVRQGFRTVLVDYNRALYALFQGERVVILDEIALSTPPARIIPNPFVRDPLTVFEANLFFWDTLKLLEGMPGSGLDEIRIYHLGDEVK